MLRLLDLKYNPDTRYIDPLSVLDKKILFNDPHISSYDIVRFFVENGRVPPTFLSRGLYLADYYKKINILGMNDVCQDDDFQYCLRYAKIFTISEDLRSKLNLRARYGILGFSLSIFLDYEQGDEIESFSLGSSCSEIVLSELEDLDEARRDLYYNLSYKDGFRCLQNDFKHLSGDLTGYLDCISNDLSILVGDINNMYEINGFDIKSGKILDIERWIGDRKMYYSLW